MSSPVRGVRYAGALVLFIAFGTPLAEPTIAAEASDVIAYVDAEQSKILLNQVGTFQNSVLPAPSFVQDLAWSPDGSMLAFTNGWDVFIINAQGNAMKQLTTDGNETFDSSPTWSPDGRQLLFGRNGAIYRIDADGTDLTLLISDGHEPAWGPQGRIAYLNDIWQEDEYEILVSNADGSNPKQATSEYMPISASPEWSPDGLAISYTTSSGLRVLDVEQGLGRPGYGATTILSSIHRPMDPAWSPDGSRIAVSACCSPVDDSTREITSVTRAGDDLKLHSLNREHDYSPAWQPACDGDCAPTNDPGLEGHSASVSLRLTKHLTVKGRFDSDVEACTSNRRWVRVQRKAGDGWTTASGVTTNDVGSFSTRVRDAAGRYRVVFDAVVAGEVVYSLCQAGTSQVVRHRH